MEKILCLIWKMFKPAQYTAEQGEPCIKKKRQQEGVREGGEEDFPF